MLLKFVCKEGEEGEIIDIQEPGGTHCTDFGTEVGSMKEGMEGSHPHKAPPSGSHHQPPISHVIL